MRAHYKIVYPNIPPEILHAAEEISVWMEQNGHKDWELLGVADRRLVTKLREKLWDIGDDLTRALKRIYPKPPI